MNEGFDEDSGLDGHVKGAGDVYTLEWLRVAELGATSHQAGHLGLGQLDFKPAEISLSHILHFVLHRWEGEESVYRRLSLFGKLKLMLGLGQTKSRKKAENEINQ